MIEQLLAQARAVQQRAHAPYSQFRVGAAILDADGNIHVGCNVENASYGLTCCAERAAVFTAVARGASCIAQVVLVTDVDPPSAPCGACRQVLMEFGGNDLVVTSVGPTSQRQWKLGELLPDSFSGTDLGKQRS